MRMQSRRYAASEFQLDFEVSGRIGRPGPEHEQRRAEQAGGRPAALHGIRARTDQDDRRREGRRRLEPGSKTRGIADREHRQRRDPAGRAVHSGDQGRRRRRDRTRGRSHRLPIRKYVLRHEVLRGGASAIQPGERGFAAPVNRPVRPAPALATSPGCAYARDRRYVRHIESLLHEHAPGSGMRMSRVDLPFATASFRRGRPRTRAQVSTGP